MKNFVVSLLWLIFSILGCLALLTSFIIDTILAHKEGKNYFSKLSSLISFLTQLYQS